MKPMNSLLIESQNGLLYQLCHWTGNASSGLLPRSAWRSAGISRRNMSGYKNIWGSNNSNSSSSQPEVKREVKAANAISSESWRLDWEEDRRHLLSPSNRWVEWRLDREMQTEGEQHRVQLEWTRYRQERGRDWARLWEDGTYKQSSGFDRGSENWWRRKHYDQEFVGSNGVQSMAAVQRALQVLEVSDAGDASAVRAAYLRLVNKWHPDRFQVEEDRLRAAEVFREVTSAYNLLKEFKDH